ncbi:MAG: NAD(P)/FAD-dependent oxidoreductase [Phaeodactylibacter sp.]|nr:NAD(P)/FAD-dependent oxidoreductase [Phaeodactylibacter sp.]MCB9292059.1 NAD(P)/FAD-dependent oxidoreductase [Lewinellaceae bacterium]
MKKRIIVIGGGAAGFFAAIRCAELNPEAEVTILEAGKDVLSKVKISGGGRCNVTHACFVPKELSKNYPRGERELIGPFHRFCTGDTVEWFEKRGVPTKIEEDGRMFPTTNKSQTIVDCLQESARRAGVEVLLQQRVHRLEPPAEGRPHWLAHTKARSYPADTVLVATGSSPAVWKVLAELGHCIVDPVPSLFTFNIRDPRIEGLPGVSVPKAEVKVEGSRLIATGPLLITHWGMSGPAILRLSAWGARELAEKKYSFSIRVNWVNQHVENVRETLNELRQNEPKKQPYARPLFGLPTRLWRSLLAHAGVPEQARWAELSKNATNKLTEELAQGSYAVNGKSTFKEEFVTAGGVDLKEVDFKTFQSKLFPGLFFAGEVLNIDAITGGFNFQAAWTGGWIAGEGMVGGLEG